MNVKRFVAKTAREALVKVRQSLGDNAVILANRSVPDGVEVLAMPEHVVDAMAQNGGMTDHGEPAPQAQKALPAPAVERAQPASRATAPARQPETSTQQQVADDVEKLAMSTLSFQDYVRQRLHERSQAATIDANPAMDEPLPPAPPQHLPRMTAAAKPAAPASRDTKSARATAQPEPAPGAAAARAETDVLAELRAMKGMIEEQLGTMAWLDRTKQHPLRAKVLRHMLACGFSAQLSREIVDRMPDDYTEQEATRWLQEVLTRNLRTHRTGIEERGGMYALVGPTGVGKTTTTAKLAASFALRYGAQNVGLITLDTYRVGAHDQLRAYGKILGLPVHVAHDAAALADLVQLLSQKKMVLIDTVGMGQRDQRLKDLMTLLDHPRIERLLVLNAAAQAETLEDVVVGYGGSTCAGAIISKLDEAVNSGSVLDCVIRHGLTLTGVANGQRVPEDWHAPNGRMLVHRALKERTTGPFNLADQELGTMYAVKSLAAGELHA